MAKTSRPILVAGAGGFIGGWLVRSLLADGETNIRAVDIKLLDEWYQEFPEVENLVLDLKDPRAAEIATKDARIVYNLAADMGGMGFIEANKALCMLSVLINTNLLVESKKNKVEKYFFASSACVYNQEKQLVTENPGLREEDAPKAALIPPRRTANTAGKNYLAKECAAFSLKTSGYK